MCNESQYVAVHKRTTCKYFDQQGNTSYKTHVHICGETFIVLLFHNFLGPKPFLASLSISTVTLALKVSTTGKTLPPEITCSTWLGWRIGLCSWCSSCAHAFHRKLHEYLKTSSVCPLQVNPKDQTNDRDFSIPFFFNREIKCHKFPIQKMLLNVCGTIKCLTNLTQTTIISQCWLYSLERGALHPYNYIFQLFLSSDHNPSSISLFAGPSNIYWPKESTSYPICHVLIVQYN